MFYGRVKVSGKVIRKKLDTDVYTTAKLRLLDFLKDQKTAKVLEPTKTDPVVPPPSFQEARALYESEMIINPAFAAKTIAYKKFNLGLIDRTWPDLRALTLDSITPKATLEWTNRLKNTVSAEAYNHTVSVFKQVFHRGAREYTKVSGKRLENPAADAPHLGVKPKQLRLPEVGQFNDLVMRIATAGGGFSKRCADLVRFLAFSGCRISEARRVRWADIDWERNQIVVNSAKIQTTSNIVPIRRIPIITQMKELLHRMRSERPHEGPNEPVCEVFECSKALVTACKKVGIPKLTHHDLRHLFATRCIESGVDIQTVSRWLGHKDGGVLAMRTYGHLRDEHSQEMAVKVRF